MTVREQIAQALEAAARKAGGDGELPDLELARAKNPAHGDYASPVGLKLARTLRRPPPQIAAEVATSVRIPGVSAEALGGYVNFRLTPDWLRGLVARVAADPEYGGSHLGGGQKVQVEFLSTNPTGPFHVGHGRGAILGDSLARLLEFTGHRVQREYYVNDQNTQAKKFGESILARYRGEEPPEGGYQGEYVKLIAEEARERGVEATADALRRFGIERMIAQYLELLSRLRIRYDEWFFESEVWNQQLGQEALGIFDPVPFTRVTIEDTFWAPRLRVNREKTIPHIFTMLKKTGCVDAYTLQWKPGREKAPHQFWDSDVAKWIEAASYSLAVHPDSTLDGLLDEVIALIASAQQPDGYLNPHYTIVEPDKRWTNLRLGHELYCAGHMIEAGVAHFQATGKSKLLDVVCRYADYIDTVFGREAGKKRGYCGHEEIELALVKLYRVTGNTRYLHLSQYFIDERGQSPCYFDTEPAPDLHKWR